MATQRVTIQFAATGPLGEGVGRDLRVEGVPLGPMLVLTCTGDAKALAALADMAGPDHALRAGADSVTLLVESASVHEAIVAALERTGSSLLPPIVWAGGEAIVTAITPDARGLVDALGGRLVRASPVSATATTLAEGPALRLTPRQAQALVGALDRGYYDAPRRSTAGEVAAALGVGRSTFEEHLRAAEREAVRLVAPLARAQANAERGASDAERAEALRVYAAFSRQLGLYVEMGIRDDKVARLRLVEKLDEAALSGSHPHLERVLRHLEDGASLDGIPRAEVEAGFARDVYDALLGIPPGETATYAEIAKRIGRPRAARAVGTACARNPVLLLVPCHRVVPASGRVGAYAGAGGPFTKALLLDLERARTTRG